MDRMKTRFIIAVTGQLSAAQESAAKVDLIEELSENLYQRYLELVGSGMDEEAAYQSALEDLGDVEELLAYLKSLGPDGELPHSQTQEKAKAAAGDFAHTVEDIVRETISQTRDAVDQAKVIVRDVAKKLKEKYPNGFDGKIDFHWNDERQAPADYDDDHGEHPYGEDHEDEESQQADSHGWNISLGYDRSRGFFCERGNTRPVEGTQFPSADIKAMDVELTNGDVTVRLDEDASADVSLDGDVDQLEVRLSETGTLMIRQGKTASSSFFFGRGLARADVELTLPRRLWENIRIATVNGDVDLDDEEGLEAGTVLVRTTSGDLHCDGLRCRALTFKSVSGDLTADAFHGDLQAESLSGDVALSGDLGALRVNTASGDVEFHGDVEAVLAATASGDVRLDCQSLPEKAELSSKSGDCELYVPDGAGFTLEYSTVSGELTSEFDLTGTVGTKSGSAIWLDGGESVLSLSSVSGDVALRKA